MERGVMSFTAVFLRSHHGYVGLIEELPGVNAHGRTLDQARESFLLTIPVDHAATGG